MFIALYPQKAAPLRQEHPRLDLKWNPESSNPNRASDDIRHVAALAAHHLRFKDVTRMRTSTLKRFLRMDRLEEHLELHRLDCLSSHRLLDHYNFAKSKLAEFSTAQLKPTPLLTGHDLIAAGFQPGPAFARILKAVEDAQLDSEITTREEALELVRRLFEPPEGRRYPEHVPPRP